MPFGILSTLLGKMPFGILSTLQHFPRMLKALPGLDGVLCLMDDGLVFGSVNDERLLAALTRIHAVGATEHAAIAH